jgi:hypothetical protein
MSFQINRGRRQQSLGTELVRRKILLLREKYNLHIRLSIDFLDPIAKTGTLVQLEIGQPGNLNVSKLPG